MADGGWWMVDGGWWGDVKDTWSKGSRTTSSLDLSTRPAGSFLLLSFPFLFFFFVESDCACGPASGGVRWRRRRAGSANKGRAKRLKLELWLCVGTIAANYRASANLDLRNAHALGIYVRKSSLLSGAEAKATSALDASGHRKRGNESGEEAQPERNCIRSRTSPLNFPLFASGQCPHLDPTDRTSWRRARNGANIAPVDSMRPRQRGIQLLPAWNGANSRSIDAAANSLQSGCGSDLHGNDSVHITVRHSGRSGAGRVHNRKGVKLGNSDVH